MQEVKVLVPEDRVPEFYEMFGRWLAGVETAGESAGPVTEWRDTEDDLALAKVLWGKLSDRAQAMFGVLMAEPDRKFSGEWLASELEIPNGKYGVAGVLAWPGRHCKALGRQMPIRQEEGDVGDSANYWMTPEIAALFRKARDDR
jgi:hypothetical protein